MHRQRHGQQRAVLQSLHIERRCCLVLIVLNVMLLLDFQRAMTATMLLAVQQSALQLQQVVVRAALPTRLTQAFSATSGCVLPSCFC